MKNTETVLIYTVLVHFMPHRFSVNLHRFGVFHAAHRFGVNLHRFGVFHAAHLFSVNLHLALHLYYKKLQIH